MGTDTTAHALWACQCGSRKLIWRNTMNEPPCCTQGSWSRLWSEGDNQQWSLVVCVERCWKLVASFKVCVGARTSLGLALGVGCKKKGGGRIWLAGSRRVTHPCSSLDVELGGLFWAAVARAVAHAHSRSRWLTNIWSYQIFLCWFRSCVCMCVCACWRKMKVVWWPNHNTEARFKTDLYSTQTPLHPCHLWNALLHPPNATISC